MGKFSELMRVGKFKDRHGAEYDITRAVLDRIVETFTPAKPPAIFVGHPDVAKPPAFGVVEALKVAGDKLLFKPARYAAEFAALVAEGKFPGVSAGLSADLSRLDHVALLSAQKPAIDGLTPIAEFSTAPEGETVSLDVSESAAGGLAEFAAGPDWWTSSRLKDVAGVLRGIKNSMIEADGVEKAELLIPEYVINRLLEDPPEPAAESDAGAVGFSAGAAAAAPVDAPPPDSSRAPDAIDYEAEFNKLTPQFENALRTIATMEEATKKLSASNVALAKKVEAFERHERMAEFGAWVEERIAEGRVLPGEKAAVVAYMERLCQGAGAEFSDDPAGNPYPLDTYKADIMARPKRKLTEAARGPEFSGGAVDTDEFVSMVHQYQSEMRAKGTEVDLLKACGHVRRALGQA